MKKLLSGIFAAVALLLGSALFINAEDVDAATLLRVYNPNSGEHHYTANTNERNHLVKVGWRYEGVSWYSGGSKPLYRLYNPNAKSGAHHYTLLQSERNNLIKQGWRNEGTGWYGQ